MSKRGGRWGDRRDAVARRRRITPGIIDDKRSGPAFACAPQLGQTLGGPRPAPSLPGRRPGRPAVQARGRSRLPSVAGETCGGNQGSTSAALILFPCVAVAPTCPLNLTLLFPSDLSTPPAPDRSGTVRRMASHQTSRLERRACAISLCRRQAGGEVLGARITHPSA